jgi:hypothetical protein
MRRAAFYDRTSIVTERYCRIGDGLDSLESEVHSPWHIYYQLGRHTLHEMSDQDRLVLDILRIQGKRPLAWLVTGVLSKIKQGDNPRRSGIIWSTVSFGTTILNCSHRSCALNCNAITGTIQKVTLLDKDPNRINNALLPAHVPMVAQMTTVTSLGAGGRRLNTLIWHD